MVRDYAGANIEDLKKTCEETREVATPEGLRDVSVSVSHDWEEIRA